MKDEQTRIAAIAMYVSGASCTEVAAQFGVSKPTVTGWVRRHGFHVRGKNECRATDLTMHFQEVKERYLRGESLKSIADSYGTVKQSVTGLMRRRGVPRRTKPGAKKSVNRDARYLKAYGCTESEFNAIYDGPPLKGSNAFKYRRQQARAKQRDIGWEFTFPEWWAVWQASGKWDRRGRGHGYVMARKGDTGPYSPSNVEIIRQSQNISDAHRNHLKKGRLMCHPEVRP